MSDYCEKNNIIWNESYKSYDENILIPGVKFPNEYLINFIYNLNKVNPGKNLRILELGFGGITNMMMMAKHGCTVDGLEVSLDAVNRTKAAIKQYGLEEKLSVELYNGNNLIPKDDSTYDAVVGLQCCYYNLDQNKFAKECNRVLKSNGVMLLSFFSRNHEYMSYIEEGNNKDGIVTFNNKHPNSKLRGLNLYLYTKSGSFCKTYGRYFYYSVGHQDLNYAPIYSSWNYLTCIKSQDQADILNNTPVPARADLINQTKNKVNTSSGTILTSKNEFIFEKNTYYNDYSDYPSEHVVRFLSTKNRKNINNYFTKRHSLSDNSLPGVGLTAVDLGAESYANVGAALTFGYDCIAVVEGPSIADLIKSKNKTEKLVDIKLWDKTYIPLPDSSVDVIFSPLFASFYLEQDYLIKELSRISKDGAEIFFMYISPRHGIIKDLERYNNLYVKKNQASSAQSVERSIIKCDKEILENTWGAYFDVDVYWVEDNMSSIFSSYYVVKGVKITK